MRGRIRIVTLEENRKERKGEIKSKKWVNSHQSLLIGPWL